MVGNALMRCWALWLLAGCLFLGMDQARAQSPPSDRNQKAGKLTGKEAKTQRDRAGKSSPSGKAAGTAQAQAQGTARTPPRREFSEAYRESLRRTVEKRRELRARRRMGSDASIPPGAIVPWPMPPALIIRHTPDVHGEISSFLDVLRR